MRSSILLSVAFPLASLSSGSSSTSCHAFQVSPSSPRRLLRVVPAAPPPSLLRNSVLLPRDNNVRRRQRRRRPFFLADGVLLAHEGVDYNSDDDVVYHARSDVASQNVAEILNRNNNNADDDDSVERTKETSDDDDDDSEKNNNGIIFSKFASRVKRFLRTQQPGAATLLLSLSIFLLPLFMMSAFPESAWAVQSGGRMGGSFGSSRSSSSSSSSYSRSSGYSRGCGGGGRGYSNGGCYYPSRTTNVVVSPGIRPFYSPFYSPFSPFYARPSGVVVSAGPSFGGLFFFAGLFIFASLVLSNIGSGASDAFRGTTMGRSVARSSGSSVLGPGVSVAEISVALEVPDRDDANSILSALDRLSNTARTDSRVGLQNLTSQVAMELLRRRSSIVAANTRARHFRDGNAAQREYNNASIRERGKFQRETVSRYGGVDYGDKAGAKTSKTMPSEYSAKATVAVVTIVVMIDGDSTSKQLSSRIGSIGDVEDALTRIAADVKADECLRGAEILWTPEERDDTLTMRDALADYPSLRSV